MTKRSNVFTQPNKKRIFFVLFHRLGLILVSLLLLCQCAKDRPVENLPDPDEERLEKVIFSGEGKSKKIWLSKVTVTSVSSQGGFVWPGIQSPSRLGYFDFTDTTLRYLRAFPPQTNTEEIQSQLINEWNISHIDLRLEKSDGQVTHRQVEDDHTKKSKRRYFKVDWSEAKVTESSTFPYAVEEAQTKQCWTKRGTHLRPQSLRVQDDYIGFTIRVDYQKDADCPSDPVSVRRELGEDFTFSVDYMYSFSRYQSTAGYQPIAYSGPNDPQMSKYGFFQREKESTRHKQEEYSNVTEGVNLRHLVNRWNRSRTDSATGSMSKKAVNTQVAQPIIHRYFFSKDFPEQWKWIFNSPEIGIFPRTNALLKEHHIGMQFQVHENDWCDSSEKRLHFKCGYPGVKQKSYGDIRYSIIKWVEDDAGFGGLLGYGPFTDDPLTGEIRSANIFIFSGRLKYLIDSLFEEWNRRKGHQESSLLAKVGQILGFSTENKNQWALGLEQSEKLNRAFKSLLPFVTYAEPGSKGLTRAPRMEDLESDRTQIRPFQGLSLLSEELRQEVSSKLSYLADESGASFGQQGLNAESQISAIHSVESSLNQAWLMFSEGASKEGALNSILYYIANHEFGHNLGLRHNYYGSVDHDHFQAAQTMSQPVLSNSGVVHLDDSRLVSMESSSVMDFYKLSEWGYMNYGWGSYDQAALVYMYSDSQLDLADAFGGDFLFCSDEHRNRNAMCRAGDTGSSPSQVVMSLIQRYDDAYFIENFRRQRNYWDASNYNQSTYNRLLALKKFLLLSQTGLNPSNIQKYLHELGWTKQDIDSVLPEIQNHLDRANSLVVALYNAIIAQSSSERDLLHRYSSEGSQLEQVGIYMDKVYALELLLGDKEINYNPNAPMSHASYLFEATRSIGEFEKVFDDVAKSVMTQKIDMESWFLPYSWSLYAQNATNDFNQSRASLIERLQLTCFTREALQEKLNVDSSLLDQVLKLGRVDDLYFQSGEEVAIVMVDRRFYVSSRSRNPYSYALLSKIVEDLSWQRPVGPEKHQVLEMYRLFKQSIGANLNCEGD